MGVYRVNALALTALDAAEQRGARLPSSRRYWLIL